MVREKVELAIQKIGEEMERDGKVDLVKWLFFLATDISGHLMFGESFRTLEEGKVSSPSALFLFVPMTESIH